LDSGSVGPTIEFKNVTFSYPSKGPVLNSISFVVAPGKTVALVGPSGSGKSTISKLLCRFYEPASGNILINGQDISQVTLKSLRQSIGIVPQEAVMFNDTVENNIFLAVAGVEGVVKDINSIQMAARKAQIEDFILKLPDGYQSIVGER
jgi:ABC-type multidrug transport system fused ATPase/permease subunit